MLEDQVLTFGSPKLDGTLQTEVIGTEIDFGVAIRSEGHGYELAEIGNAFAVKSSTTREDLLTETIPIMV